MDVDLHEKRLRDEQMSNEPQDVQNAQIEERLKQVHTSMPGIIVSFDPGTQVAEVQPSIKRMFTKKGPVDLPLCVDVLCAFPGGKRFYLTYPVEPGDECILIFSERCIDLWYLEGDTQEPDDYRMHDMSDAMAIVGINNLTKPIEDFQMDGIEIRSPLRESFVKVKEDTIEVFASVLVDVKAPTITATATGTINASAPTVNGSGDTLNLNFGQINLIGNVTHSGGNFSKTGGTIKHDGKDIGKTHQHGGITTGIANSGVPI